jgi:hypothetical protein
LSLGLSAQYGPPGRRVPPLAPIGTTAPPAVPPCRAPPSAALLRARVAEPNWRPTFFISPIKTALPRLLFPPLTPSKLMRSKTPPLPAASPPPHHLPYPIKRTLASASPQRTRCSPPSPFSASPVTRHRAPPLSSPPLHRRPHPAIAPVTKACGEDRQDPLYLFLQPQ